MVGGTTLEHCFRKELGGKRGGSNSTGAEATSPWEGGSCSPHPTVALNGLHTMNIYVEKGDPLWANSGTNRIQQPGSHASCFTGCWKNRHAARGVHNRGQRRDGDTWASWEPRGGSALQQRARGCAPWRRQPGPDAFSARVRPSLAWREQSLQAGTKRTSTSCPLIRLPKPSPMLPAPFVARSLGPAGFPQPRVALALQSCAPGPTSAPVPVPRIHCICLRGKNHLIQSIFNMVWEDKDGTRTTVDGSQVGNYTCKWIRFGNSPLNS